MPDFVDGVYFVVDAINVAITMMRSMQRQQQARILIGERLDLLNDPVADYVDKVKSAVKRANVSEIRFDFTIDGARVASKSKVTKKRRARRQHNFNNSTRGLHIDNIDDNSTKWLRRKLIESISTTNNVVLLICSMITRQLDDQHVVKIVNFAASATTTASSSSSSSSSLTHDCS